MNTSHQIASHGGNRTRENTMFNSKLARLGARTGLAFSFYVLSFAFLPQTVLADNECNPVGSSPSDNGSDPDSYVCSGVYAGGVTYSSEGNLTITTNSTDVGPNGINLVGNNSDSLNLVVNSSLESTSSASGTDWLIGINTSGLATVENNFVIGHDDADNRDLSVDEAAIFGEGPGSIVINNSRTIKGRLDFSDLDGGVVLNNNSALTGNTGWNTAGTSYFSSNADVVVNNGLIQTSSGGHEDPAPSSPLTVMEFGGGDDTFNNAGILAAGTSNSCLPNDPCPPKQAVTVFAELENFNNTGLILLGRGGGSQNRQPENGTDALPDDILSMPGTHFEGSGNSRVEFDVVLSGSGQSACNGQMADCLDLSDGSTAGSTLVTVRDVFEGDRGDTADILLIDVNGGTSSADHFTLDPNSSKYNPAHGGVIDKGLLIYPLAYDAANQQHKLAATPSDDAMQMPFMVEAAEATWRTATATWFDRQADLRNTLREPGTGGGIWVRGATASGERDAKQSVSAYSRTLDYDNSHDVDTSAINIGLDLVSASEGNRAWVLGAMIGYAHASAEFDQSANDAQIDGMTAGLYGSFVAGDFFVDGVLNGAWTELDFEIPDLGLVLGQDGNVLTADIDSLGAQIESGWRLRAGPIGVEPLASLSYVRTTFDDMQARSSAGRRPATTIDFGDNTSTRGGLGVRLTLDSAFDGLHATWSLTGKVLEEFDEESEVSLQRLGPAAKLASEMDGTITEVSGGVGIHNASGSVSAFLNANLQSSDDYDSQGLSAGFRYQW